MRTLLRPNVCGTAARATRIWCGALHHSHRAMAAAGPAQDLDEGATKRVAVVGGGVAGLFCASTLSQYGYAVSLFDMGKAAPGEAARAAGAGLGPGVPRRAVGRAPPSTAPGARRPPPSAHRRPHDDAAHAVAGPPV
jgi:NADPH-dependent 2,4-dienoyl-CoA reductase/sulfur reductase-like enzyme